MCECLSVCVCVCVCKIAKQVIQYFTDSTLSKNVKKKKRTESTKQKSLSPLSKRMAFIPGNKGGPEDNSKSQLCNQLYRPSSINIEYQDPIDEYEVRVNICLFLSVIYI